MPQLLASRNLQCGDTRLALWASRVGHGHIDVLFVGSETPLNAAEGAAAAKSNLPENLPALVWIERVEHGRLLPGQQYLFAVGRGAQDR
jgi:hypothetical protein